MIESEKEKSYIYVLIADIDFGGEIIDPSGFFVPVGTEGADAKTLELSVLK